MEISDARKLKTLEDSPSIHVTPAISMRAAWLPNLCNDAAHMTLYALHHANGVRALPVAALRQHKNEQKRRAEALEGFLTLHVE
jgi:hypothetical protein